MDKTDMNFGKIIFQWIKILIGICGFYLIIRLLIRTIRAIINHRIVISWIIPANSEYPIIYDIIYALILCGGIYGLILNKWSRLFVVSSGTCIIAMLMYIQLRIDTHNMQKKMFHMGKERLEIYTTKKSDKYIGKYSALFHSTYFYGVKRDSANYMIFDETVDFIQRLENRQLKFEN